MPKNIQIVKPIKDNETLNQVCDTLKNNFRQGIRNYTIFAVGVSTLLRVSDVLALKYDDVYNEKGIVKKEAYIVDKKTGKHNVLYLSKIKNVLRDYHDFLVDNDIHSKWLFPSSYNSRKGYKNANIDKHVDERQFYRIMQKVGDLLGLDYLGTHTMRKTGAYRVYEQSHYNIGLVMNLLNHSSEQATLHYLGIDRDTTQHALDSIDLGFN